MPDSPRRPAPPTAAQRRRQAAEQRRLQQAERGPRQRRITIVGVGAMVVFTAVVIGATVAQRHSTQTATAGGAGLVGLQSTAAPWAPEYAHLPERLAALDLPPNGDESYHIHAHLAVYVDGHPVPVPADVGISAAAGLESPMHTHDVSGVIHIEASKPSDAFTLGAFFDLWGVTFTPDTLGGYQSGDGKTVQVYVNGQLVTDGPARPVHTHDDIVVIYGAPGSSPTTDPYTWPAGE